MSVSDYMDYWFEQYVLVNTRYNTQTTYKATIENHIKPYLGKYKLPSISSQLLQKFFNDYFAKGSSKSKLVLIKNIINSSLKYAVHPCKFIKENPIKYIQFPKYKNNNVKNAIITNEDFSKIINKFSSEVFSLLWDDIDFENKTMNINKIIYRIKKGWALGLPKTATSKRIIVIGVHY